MTPVTNAADLEKMVNPKVAASLDKWHQLVINKDMTGLESIVHPDARFRSPIAIHPYESRAAVILALSTVINVFEDFTYYRQFATPDGLNVTLEFGARVGGKQLKGVDLIQFNEEGQILEFEVAVRPLSATQALGAEMGKRLGGRLPAFKSAKL